MLHVPLDELIMKDGTCGVCRPGKGYNSYSPKCKSCWINEYINGNVDQVCSSCRKFSHSLRGATECFKCAAGHLVRAILIVPLSPPPPDGTTSARVALSAMLRCTRNKREVRHRVAFCARMHRTQATSHGCVIKLREP